jgi:hypothetical protein
LGGKAPQRKTAQQLAIVFGQKTGDGGETPVLVRLVELGGLDARGMKPGTARLELRQVASSQVNVGGVILQGNSTSVLNSCMCGLNSLLRERNVATRDAI